VRQVTYCNALAAYGRNGQMQQDDWLNPAPIDQRTLYNGNSVLRSGQAPRIEAPRQRDASLPDQGDAGAESQAASAH